MTSEYWELSVLTMAPFSRREGRWAGVAVAGKVISSRCGTGHTGSTPSSRLPTCYTGEENVAGRTGFVLRRLLWICACNRHTSYPDRCNDRRGHRWERTISMNHEKCTIPPSTFSLQKKGTVPQKACEWQATLPCSIPLAACGQCKEKEKHQQCSCWGGVISPELQLPCLALMLAKPSLKSQEKKRKSRGCKLLLHRRQQPRRSRKLIWRQTNPSPALPQDVRES